MRERKLTIFIVALVCVGLLAKLFLYTVGVDEAAAHYRFGKVVRVIRPTLSGEAEPAGVEVNPGVEVVTEAGLFAKLPWPFDRVDDYSQKVRYVDGKQTQTQLEDGNQVIPRIYATWRVTDPVAFKKSLRGDEGVARMRLQSIIDNETNATFGGFQLEDLVSTDPQELQFDAVERDIYDGVKTDLKNMSDSYGIELCSLGITWIALPEDTTQAVFNRMTEERKSVAEKLIADGERIKRTKVAEATLQSRKIVAAAEARAKDIRAEAEAEAAGYYETFAKNQHLAIFLRRLEALRAITQSASDNGKPMTLVVSTKTEPFSILDTGPDKSARQAGPEVPEVPVRQLSASEGN
ncbi:MAG: SPFH domain-containing protein [Planctomycetota bacterium]